jgi:hypothetical protein
MLHDAVSLNSTYPPKVILNRHGTFEEYRFRTSNQLSDWSQDTYYLRAWTSIIRDLKPNYCSYPSLCPNGCKRAKCVGSSPTGPIIFNEVLNPVSTDPIQPLRYPCTQLFFSKQRKGFGQTPVHRAHPFVLRALHGLRNLNPLTKPESSTHGWTESKYACGMTLA